MQNTAKPATAFAGDVLSGLTSDPKHLPSKYFYDEKGDKIFQQIMAMPEYYLTNCEFDNFIKNKAEILAFATETDFDLIELGAGDGTKTKILLQYLTEQAADFRYLPIDISAHALRELAADLEENMPAVKVETQQGDYFEVLENLKNIGTRPKLVLFLGSNIGNFSKTQAVDFLQKMHAALSPGDLLLIGADLKKDPAVIRLAYNDPAGITAAFNLNLLERMNRELGANFLIKNWKHWETYNPATGETKSYLVSKCDQTVHISALHRSFDFAAWEAVWVELSQKYSLSELENLAESAGFRTKKHFLSDGNYFTDSLFVR